jgi:hypothetical protein
MAPLVKPMFAAIWLLVSLGMALSVESRVSQRGALDPAAACDPALPRGADNRGT